MSSIKNLEFEKTAFLSKANSAFIEEMYTKFVANDPNLPESWKKYFEEIGEELDVIVNELNRLKKLQTMTLKLSNISYKKKWISSFITGFIFHLRQKM